MNKPLLLSLAAAALLSTNLNAESMYERIQAMELQMKQMQAEIQTLKSHKSETMAAEDDDEELEDDDTQEEIASDEADSQEEEDDDEEDSIEDQLADIQENLTELNKGTNGNHLKFGVDYRFAIENMNYKMADGSTAKNNAFMTNRFWLNMDWSATENLSFHGQIAYNKAFGARSGASNPATASYETFDWVANENAFDDTLRVRSVYFLYKNDTFFDTDIPWTFSIGRRPSTNGHLVNLRDDDHAASPMGHTINVEFDGLSSKFALEDVVGVNGMYVKFCAGRGMSNAAPKFTSTPYTDVNNLNGANTNIDLAGLIFVPYDNGQYSIGSQYYYASNLIDSVNPANQLAGFKTVGGLHSVTANFTANGIGDEINDYLDDTIFFVSGAMSITDPNSNERMLYGAVDANGIATQAGESKTGYSAWVGLQMPSFVTDDGRWGMEYNYGSQYWRSITYAEDTNIGSKLATRGNAYEVYFTEYLIDDILSLQLRYTYIDYDYTGSNGFFGDTTGASMSMDDAVAAGMGSQVVDKAQDIRFYLRYKY